MCKTSPKLQIVIDYLILDYNGNKDDDYYVIKTIYVTAMFHFFIMQDKCMLK